jgi:hypothetical protein
MPPAAVAACAAAAPSKAPPLTLPRLLPCKPPPPCRRPGAINDTLSWTTVRPLGVLPLDARCKPGDLKFEDGEAAAGPPLDPKIWGACETVRRLDEMDGCDEGAAPDACPPLEGPYGERARRRGWLPGGQPAGMAALPDAVPGGGPLPRPRLTPSRAPICPNRPLPLAENWLYGAMLRRTFSLLGGSAWGKQLIADWWTCDSAAGDAAACAAVNASTPAWMRHMNGKPPHGGVDDDDQPVVGDDALLVEPLLAVDPRAKPLSGPAPRGAWPGGGGAVSGAGGGGGYARGALLAAAAASALAALA